MLWMVVVVACGGVIHHLQLLAMGFNREMDVNSHEQPIAWE
jgi:hypothetical protein